MPKQKTQVHKPSVMGKGEFVEKLAHNLCEIESIKVNACHCNNIAVDLLGHYLMTSADGGCVKDKANRRFFGYNGVGLSPLLWIGCDRLS